MRYDVCADWEINMFCNFRCEYCFIPDEKKQNPEYRGYDIEKIINGFNKAGPVFLIHMSGGEPFLQPQFVDLCKGLTKKHFISVNTNLSTKNVYDFVEQLNPKKVEFVHCSLHIDEIERRNLVEEFIDKCHYLRDNGFEIFVTQVLYPPVLKKFDKVFDFFRENGIIVKPKTFRGNYKYIRYPAGYTKKERGRILKYIKISKELSKSSELSEFGGLAQLEKELIYGELSFKGLPCKTGKDLIVINYDGEVIRCHSEPIKIGNIFEGKINLVKEPKICSAKICTCPYYGLRYAEGEHKIVKGSVIKSKMKYIARKIIGRFSMF